MFNIPIEQLCQEELGNIYNVPVWIAPPVATELHNLVAAEATREHLKLTYSNGETEIFLVP